MKSFRKFKEDVGAMPSGATNAPANNIGSGAVSGFSPLMGFARRKSKWPFNNRLNERSKFMGYDVFEVDTSTFLKNRFGKKKYSRWKNESKEFESDLIEYGKRTRKPIIISDRRTGMMSFFRYPTNKLKRS